MYTKNTEEAETNKFRTVGYCEIKKAHNKRSEGECSVRFLREAVEMAEEEGMETVFLFSDVHERDDGKAGILALCEEPTDDKAIVVAGRRYNE